MGAVIKPQVSFLMAVLLEELVKKFDEVFPPSGE
jgi:hypothetical protein